MYAEGPFYVIHGSIIDGLVRSGLTVRMGGPNEGRLPVCPSLPAGMAMIALLPCSFAIWSWQCLHDTELQVYVRKEGI